MDLLKRRSGLLVYIESGSHGGLALTDFVFVFA
jgi:hypothetical protein